MKKNEKNFSLRIRDLRSQFKSLGIDAFLVSFIPHLRYISGFSGTNGLGLVTRRESIFISDSRYAQQVTQELGEWRIFITNEDRDLFEEMHNQQLLRKGWCVGVDGNFIALNQYRKLKKLFPETRFIPCSDVIEKLAAVKDLTEIYLIKQAAKISDRVFTDILEIIKPGLKELDVAAEISYAHRKYGAEADAFEPIVNSGFRSALPHGRASNKKIRKGEMVTLDFGCVYDGYCCDITRTISLGKPHPLMIKIYNIVLDAQQLAIDSVKSGMETKELDAIARNYITEKGYGMYFQHSLGHGIGLQIHEKPRISKNSKGKLVRGNVITIEPGIYLPNFGGVRIEDDVSITQNHCEVLNNSEKNLIII